LGELEALGVIVNQSSEAPFVLEFDEKLEETLLFKKSRTKLHMWLEADYE